MRRPACLATRLSPCRPACSSSGRRCELELVVALRLACRRALEMVSIDVMSTHLEGVGRPLSAMRLASSDSAQRFLVLATVDFGCMTLAPLLLAGAGSGPVHAGFLRAYGIRPACCQSAREAGGDFPSITACTLRRRPPLGSGSSVTRCLLTVCSELKLGPRRGCQGIGIETHPLRRLSGE